MHSSIVLTGALAALSFAAPTPTSAPSAIPTDLFLIQTKPHNAARKDFVQYLSYFHTGAGEAALVGTTNYTEALAFYIDSTTGLLTMYETGTSIPPATVGLEHFQPYDSNAPAGYQYVSLDNGNGGTKGWVKIPNPDGDLKGNVLVYEGDAPHGKGPAVKSFALCHVNGVSPYQNVGPEYQFLWEGLTTVPKYKTCADVTLNAIEVRVPN